jgi:hypothetical protein
MDIVLTTTELLELVTDHKQEFEAITIDESVKVGWQFDELLKTGLLQEDISVEKILGRLRIFSAATHPLYTNSTTSATSNNYLNQVLIKLFRDRAGVDVSEASITETLRKNKKGFGVVSSNPGNRVQRPELGSQVHRSESLRIQEHPESDPPAQDCLQQLLRIHRANGMSGRLLQRRRADQKKRHEL